MTKDLKVELHELEAVSKSWIKDISPGLQTAAGKVDELHYTAVQFGPLFIGAWESYSKAAVYIQQRLVEGGPAAEQVGNALHTTVLSFEAQQAGQVKATTALTGEIGG